MPPNSDMHDEESPLLRKTEEEEAMKQNNRTTSADCLEDESKVNWTFIKGIVLSTLSGILFCSNNFIIKEFKVIPVDAVLVRGLVQASFLTAYSLLKSHQIKPDSHRLLALALTQGFFGAVSFIAALLAVSYMPVADALVVMFSDPLITMVVAFMFLGERMNVLRVCTGLTILTGVTLVCQPPFIFGAEETEVPDANDLVEKDLDLLLNHNETDFSVGTSLRSVGRSENYWVGVAFAIGAVLSGTFHNICVPLCKEIESTVLVLYVGLVAIFISSIAAQFDSAAMLATGKITEVSPEMWAILFGLAFSGMLAYVFLTRSLQLISPTLVSSLRGLEIIFAYVVESLIILSPPSPLSAAGGILVVCGVFSISMENEILNCWSRLRRREQYQNV